MHIWQAILLGIVEGLTEFLPVSSTGHLKITEGLLGINLNDPGVTAYTAIIQVGAIIAAIIYFRRDIGHFIMGFVRGLTSAEARQTQDWRMALAVIVGVIPAAIVGLALKSFIENDLGSLWIVANAFIAWSLAMVYAEYVARQKRAEGDLTYTDALVIGVFQCVALIPGVSRSGATITGGLVRGLDRVTATRFSFFIGIPTLTAAGGLEALSQAKQISHTVGWTPTLVGTVVSFAVGYASIAWLLRFLAHHSLVSFVWYRVAAGVILIGLLAGSVISAT